MTQPSFVEPLSSVPGNKINLNKKGNKKVLNLIRCYNTPARMANVIKTDNTKC